MSEAPETGFVAMRSILYYIVYEAVGFIIMILVNFDLRWIKDQTSPWCSTRNRSLDEITVISYLVLGSTRSYLLQNYPSNEFKIYQYLY